MARQYVSSGFPFGHVVQDGEAGREYVIPGVVINERTAAAPGMRGMKVWSGSAWAEKPVKYWSGSAWTTKPVKFWNGSTWG